MGVLAQQVKGKAEELYRKARTPAGLTGIARQWALQTGMSLDDKDLAKLQKEVEISTSDEGRLQSIIDEGNQRNKFELFKKAKELNRMLHMARTGQENLLENILVGDQVVGIEDVNDRMTAAIQEVADITSVVPVAAAGRRMLTKTAAAATERAAGKTGRLSGVFKEWADQIDATDVPLVGGPLAGAQAAAKMASDTAQAGSIAVEVGAETLKRMPTQKGIIESVAKSTRVPEKLRRAVGVFRPLDPALKVGAETVEGALIGAGVGGALGAAAEGEEGFWSGLGSGGALGGISTGAPSLLLRSAGAIHSKLDPIGKRELEADIRREGLRQVKDNLSPQSWNAMSFDDKATATTARHILGERFNVNVLDTKAFANLKAPTGVTAMYDPATKTIFVDSSSPTFKQDFLHEFGEALFDSPVVNKGDIELEIEAVYGKTELNRLKRQYAEQFVKARKVAAGEKNPKASKEEVNKELLALYQDEPNWITREIFAESVMDTLIDKNLQRFRNSSGLRRALVKAKESVFRKMGVELDATGRSLLFGDDLKNDPKLKSRIEKYTRDLDRYYKDTRNRGKATSRVSIRQQPDHPAAGFVENAEGVKENNFARINESGKVEMKNAQEVRKENAQKRKEIREEISELEVVDPSEGDFLSSKPLLNNPDRFELRGKQIPQSIKDLPMMARSKPTIEDLERAIKNGDILESWIHAIGPEDFWNVVRRRGGNVPVQKYEYMPYEFFMSQNGNLAVRVLNMDKIRAKADLLNQQGKLSFWNNDVNAFMESLKDYVMAHKEGKSAATVMSPQQRNAISGFFGLKGVGDLRKQWKASGDKGVFETQRIDRIASIDFTGRQFPFQQEYANLNFSAPRMAEMDAAYMKAVEAGNMNAAQRVVDEAAKAAGYTHKAFHDTNADKFNVFDLSRTGSAQGGNTQFYDEAAYFTIDGPEIRDLMESIGLPSAYGSRRMDVYLKLDRDKDYIPNNAEDGTEVGVTSPERIKSADPVTYDADGSPIPVSQRFDPSKDDIRFSAPRLDPRDPITADSGLSEVSDAYDRFRVGTAKLGSDKKPVNTPQESNISSDIVPDEVLAGHMEMFNYPNIPAEIRSISNPKEKRDALVNWMADNLVALYNKFPEEVRRRSTHWYDGGQRIAAMFADRYSVSMEQAAGVIAALSPQKPWFMNVSQAEQVIDVYINHQDDVITREEHGEQIEAIIQAAEAPVKQKRKRKPGETPLAKKRRQNYNKRLDQKAKDDRRKTLEKLYGKSVRTLDSDPELQGWGIRAISQALYGQDHRVISPEGDPMGWEMVEDGSAKAQSTWGGVDHIKKSVRMLKDGSVENISNNLGNKHKVRNFYNNLIAPNSPYGDATMDTHAVAAAMLMPYGASAKPVDQNFSGKGAPALGVNGTYHVYLDAYREAARRVGIQPRQMQSITWEAVRSLFPPESKKKNSKHRLSLGNTTKIWQNNNANEARNIILRDEIPAPTWARPRDSGRVDRDTPLVGEESWKQADVGGGVIFGGRRPQPTSGSGGGGVGRFSAPRQLNNRGGFVARSPSGYRAVRTSNRAGIRVYDPKGRFIGSFNKLAAAENAISDDQEE